MKYVALLILFSFSCLLGQWSVAQPSKSSKKVKINVARDSVHTLHIVVDAPLAKDKPKDNTQAIAVGFTALTIVLGCIGAVLNYRASIIQRNQWHSQLFKQFYVEDTYKEMRYILDFKPQQKIMQLISSFPQESEDRISEQFYDYLNFFEFIASLWYSEQINYEVVMRLFKYYLVMLHEERFVKKEIDSKGFEYLGLLLRKMKQCGDITQPTVLKQTS